MTLNIGSILSNYRKLTDYRQGLKQRIGAMELVFLILILTDDHSNNHILDH